MIGKELQKTQKRRWMNIMPTLLLRVQQFISDFKNFKMAIRIQVRLNALDDLLMSLPQKLIIKSMNKEIHNGRSTVRGCLSVLGIWSERKYNILLQHLKKNAVCGLLTVHLKQSLVSLVVPFSL